MKGFETLRKKLRTQGLLNFATFGKTAAALYRVDKHRLRVLVFSAETEIPENKAEEEFSTSGGKRGSAQRLVVEKQIAQAAKQSPSPKAASTSSPVAAKKSGGMFGMKICGPDKHVMYLCGDGTRGRSVCVGGVELSTSWGGGSSNELRSQGRLPTVILTT